MAEPFRVAQIVNRMDNGGIEAVIMNYYRHIDHTKVQFDFYFVADSIMDQHAELESFGAGLYPIPPYNRPLAYHRALYRAFKAHGYRVVHAHMSTMSVFPLFAAWCAGVPVRICHNHSTADRGEGAKMLLKYLLRPCNKWFATHWFACGERAGRWMYGDKAFDAGKVTVMPNAIDTASFAFDPAARQRLRAELGIAPDAFVVGHVGRFTYAKNHPFLLQVFAQLHETDPAARLLLVGEGELEQQTRQRVQELGLERAVIFTGARADVNKMYSVMDVFCLPSNFEGMPVVLWEAQVNGLPCLCSERVSREVTLDGGCRFLPLQLQAWQAALARQTAAPRERRPAPDSSRCEIRTAAEKLQAFYMKAQETIDG